MSPEENRGNGKGWRLLEFLFKRAIGLLFILAGASKGWDPAEFAREISRYQLVPWFLAVGIALYLPWVEVLSGVLIWFPRFERGALLIITFLLGVFTLALGSAWLRGLNIDCGCFGQASVATGVVYPLVRNLVLLTWVGALWMMERKSAD
jgi:putative oxidoreductase